MSSREVYRRWVLGVIVIGAIGASACTEAQIQECMSYGISRAVCEAGGTVGGGGGGGDNPPDQDNPGQQ